jgi:hypothetical protein
MKNREGAWGTWIVFLKAQLTGCERESLGKFLVVWADTVDVGTGLLEVVGVYEKPTGWEGGYHLCAWGC